MEKKTKIIVGKEKGERKKLCRKFRKILLGNTRKLEKKEQNVLEEQRKILDKQMKNLEELQKAFPKWRRIKNVEELEKTAFARKKNLKD